jgi:hypothetical protein
MLELGGYLLISLYGGVIASIFYINTCNRNNEDLMDEDIEPITARFSRRERIAMDQRLIS